MPQSIIELLTWILLIVIGAVFGYKFGTDLAIRTLTNEFYGGSLNIANDPIDDEWYLSIRAAAHPRDLAAKNFIVLDVNRVNFNPGMAKISETPQNKQTP